jgi:S-methyl-5-thioribose-1-phosphate isomerase
MTADVIDNLGKPGVLVHGINTRPGKPTILGVCHGKAVIGLPGNPVSALVNGYLFVVPVIEKLLAANPRPKATVQARLTVNLPSQAGREDWWPVHLMSPSPSGRGVRGEGESPAQIRQFVLEEAQRIADEDVEINKRMAEHGATLIDDGDTVIHHCNTGALATVDWGTALGVIRTAWEQGKKIHVLVDETRPRLQGARLTAWELEQYGIPYDIISDNMAGHFLKTGQAQKCFVGSDRTAANGDVANKIGTYMLALAAHDNGVPFYPVVPTSTIDLSLAHGGLIPIEERDPQEVLGLQFQGERVAPVEAQARNIAFDDACQIVTAIVTENIVYPPSP